MCQPIHFKGKNVPLASGSSTCFFLTKILKSKISLKDSDFIKGGKPHGFNLSKKYRLKKAMWYRESEWHCGTEQQKCVKEHGRLLREM